MYPISCAWHFCHPSEPARAVCHYVSEGQFYDQRCPSFGKVLKDKYLVREAEKGCKVWHKAVKYCLKGKMQTTTWSCKILPKESEACQKASKSFSYCSMGWFWWSWLSVWSEGKCQNSSGNLDFAQSSLCLKGCKSHLNERQDPWSAQGLTKEKGKIWPCRPLCPKCRRACAWAGRLGVPPA